MPPLVLDHSLLLLSNLPLMSAFGFSKPNVIYTEHLDFIYDNSTTPLLPSGDPSSSSLAMRLTASSTVSPKL